MYDVLPLRFKLLLPPMHHLIETELTNYDEVERQVLQECEAKGVPTEERPYYLAYGKRVFETYCRVWDATAENEVALITQEFILRDKDEQVLNQIQALMRVKAGILRWVRLIKEEWSIGAPSGFTLLHDEEWSIGAPSGFTLLHDEEWSIGAPSGFTLLHDEEWSS
jgi:hypothetical protein